MGVRNWKRPFEGWTVAARSTAAQRTLCAASPRKASALLADPATNVGYTPNCAATSRLVASALSS